MTISIILTLCTVLLLGAPIGLSWLGTRLDAKEKDLLQNMTDQLDAGFAVPFKYSPACPAFYGAFVFYSSP